MLNLDPRLKVYVLAGSGKIQIQAMFMANGYSITSDMFDSDMICFVGGDDVDPSLYKQHKHETTYINRSRDIQEQEIYQLALELGIPMVGICRGAQFLNVMNGGSLYQNVDGHATGGVHEAYIKGGVLPVKVSSTHHQMMIPTKNGTVILRAGESKEKISMSSNVDNGAILTIRTMEKDNKNNLSDVECVYYPKTNCLCFQPHPEFVGEVYKETKEIFFNFIENFLLADNDDDPDAVASEVATH